MKHVIVIGKTGQLARALAVRANTHDLKITAYGRSDCDLSSKTETLKSFAKALPACDAMIIAAAYTAVDAAEDNKDTAFQVNAVAPKVFAQECAARNIPLVHISTDYVFPGTNPKPLHPADATEPVNAYGASKLAGETAVLETQARAAILRTSWVFDGTGKNFMTTMLRLAKDRNSLSVVADQIGRPTYAGHLADASFAAAKHMMTVSDFAGGLYHVSGTGPKISWADFADAIFTQAVTQIPHTMIVNRIPSSDYPTPAKRPAFSVMDTKTFETEFEHVLPSWEDGLKTAFKEWLDTQT